MDGASAAEGHERSPFRAVALPSEHGGWGLTAEPVLLGLLLAPSGAGVLLGLAGFLAFLARTPLKVVLVDSSRHRSLPRTRLARRVVVGEGVVLVALVVGAVLSTSSTFWWPVLVAAPLVAVELWFDMRSRSRRLVPELAGSIGIASLVSIIALAGDARIDIAVGAWIVLAARAFTSIPTVRQQVASLHGRAGNAAALLGWDAVAVVAAFVAVVVDRAFVAGAIAVVVVIVAQRLLALRPTPRATIIGIRQMVFGFGVVLVTWIGVLASGGAS